MTTDIADPVENLVNHLEGVRKSGNGYSAKCPAHEDRHASLTLSTGNDGRALVKCQAGCATRDIVAAIGLTMADLFPPREAMPTPRQAIHQWQRTGGGVVRLPGCRR